MQSMNSIGIDIGKRRCDVCVVDGRGRVLERRHYPNTYKDAGTVAGTMARRYGKSSCQAACETTGNMWMKTYAAFEDAGIRILLANTFKMAIIAKTGKKTDKVDAEKIAQVLRMGMIPECHVPSAGSRTARDRLRQRAKLVQDRTRVVNRLRNLLDRHDVELEASQAYSAKAMAQMAAMDIGDDTGTVRQYARQIAYLNGEIGAIEEEVTLMAHGNEDARLLASLTGMGTHSAMLLAAEADGVSRFASPKRMVSWAGLCPTIHQSGNQRYMGRMKKMDTNKMVNWTMIEAANVAVRHDPRMAAVYESARRRHADRHAQAIVVVAHKMITIAWHMLRTRTPYESRNEKLYLRKLDRMGKGRRG